jgi:hypothetical protein
LTIGKNYCYIVRAINPSGTITAASNISCLNAAVAPVSSFIYLRSASVDFSNHVQVHLYCDTLFSCKGLNLWRSSDGVNFNLLSFIPFTGGSNYNYLDNQIDAGEAPYFYKADIIDSCGNKRGSSNTSKTILLHVKNDPAMLFNNNLTWSDYSSWSGGVMGYNIYRVVDQIPQSTPIQFVPYGTTQYTDNVEDIVKESGKVGYFVQAVENFGNIYGFTDQANSNISIAYVEGTVFVPNAFVPKGVNRTWLPVAQFVEKSDYLVSVFSRWGTKVFETNDDTKGWDGSDMEEGVYAYVIQYKNSRGEFVQLKGTVTLVR